MKTTFKTLAILMMATIGFTACGDDDNTEDENLKEYALQVKVNLTPNDTTVVEQLHKSIETALSSIGMSKDTPYLYLAARDSADAAPKVQEIGKKLEAVLDKNASQMYGNAYILAIEKQRMEASDGKKIGWSCWYEANYPESENVRDEKHNSQYWNYWVKSKQYFVYKLELQNESSVWHWAPSCKMSQVNGYPDTYSYLFADITDLNDGARGNYLYLKMTGINVIGGAVSPSQLITDIVMLNTGEDGHYPESVDITGDDGKSRRYFPVFTDDKGANGSTRHDLNDKAGYPYLWMYYTTDERNGWVLANTDGDSWNTRVLRNKDNREDREGRCYMHEYRKNDSGEWVDHGIADMNRGVGGDDIFLSMGFRKL